MDPLDQKAQKMLSEFEAAVQLSPMAAIDQIMAGMLKPEGSQPGCLRRLRALFARAVLTSAAGRGGPDTNLHQLFARDHSHEVRRFIAASLLRLFTVCPDFANGTEYRHQTIGLCDEVFGEELYRFVKIDRRQQNHEKFQALIEAVESAERDLIGVVTTLKTLDDVQSCRQTLMQKLNLEATKCFVHPFLPQQPAISARVNNIFSVVENYRSQTGPGKIRAYQTAISALQAQANEATSFGTKYSLLILVALLNQLLRLVQNDFEASELSKPAQLECSPSDKKYPFNSIRSQFNLSFVVSNRGLGHAFDATLRIVEISEEIEVLRTEFYLGTVAKGSTNVDVPCRVKSAEKIAIGTLELEWTQFDNSTQVLKLDFELQGQRADINWDALAAADPFSLLSVAQRFSRSW